MLDHRLYRPLILLLRALALRLLAHLVGFGHPFVRARTYALTRATAACCRERRQYERARQLDKLAASMRARAVAQRRIDREASA